MTSFSDNKVRSSLTKKGFFLETTHHKCFHFYNNEGKKTSIRTRVSHNGQDINDYLIIQMAKQTHLTKSQFIDLINCPLTKEMYIEILKKQGIY